MNEKQIKNISDLEKKLTQDFKNKLTNFKNFRKKDLMIMYNTFSKLLEYNKKMISEIIIED